MPRSTRLVPIASVAVALLVGPILSATALAADPVTVRPGDTLTSISRSTGVPIAEIARLNDIADPNRIYIGQRLRLEADEPPPRPAASKAPAPAKPAARRTHVVARGEHLTGIARRYGVTIAALVEANGIANPSRIIAGQRLVIPGRAPEAPSSPKPAAPAAKPAARRTHVVARGEHLTGIARRYGVTIAALVEANGIANPSRIFAGQRLVIPGAVPATAPSAATPKPSPSLPASMRALMDRRASVRDLILAEAGRYDVPAPLALALAWQESGWRQDVVSPAGAVGIMQVLPATGDWVGPAMLGRRVDLRDARDNVQTGVRLLAHYLDRYDGNVDLALAAYYQGQTAADRHGVYPVSRPYIASIKAIAKLLGG